MSRHNIALCSVTNLFHFPLNLTKLWPFTILQYNYLFKTHKSLKIHWQESTSITIIASEDNSNSRIKMWFIISNHSAQPQYTVAEHISAQSVWWLFCQEELRHQDRTAETCSLCRWTDSPDWAAEALWTNQIQLLNFYSFWGTNLLM